MFQNLVVTGLTPLCNTDEIANWDNRPFNGKWPENQRSIRGTEVTKTIRKKPKRIRTAYTTDQLRALEKIYAGSKYIDAKRRKELSATLNIGDKALKIWFQNRRMKEKKGSSESSDSSSEIVSCPSPAKESCDLNEVLTSVPITNYDSHEPVQYQFPSWNYNDIQRVEYQNGYGYFQNDTSFGLDTSVYPTQYYPAFNEQCSIGDMQAHGHAQAAQFYNSEVDNWYAKSFDLTYF